MTTIAEIRAAYIKDRAEEAWTSKGYDEVEAQATEDFDAALKAHVKAEVAQAIALRENPDTTPGGKIRCYFPIERRNHAHVPCKRPLHHDGMHDTVSWVGE